MQPRCTRDGIVSDRYRACGTTRKSNRLMLRRVHPGDGSQRGGSASPGAQPLLRRRRCRALLRRLWTRDRRVARRGGSRPLRPLRSDCLRPTSGDREARRFVRPGGVGHAGARAGAPDARSVACRFRGLSRVLVRAGAQVERHPVPWLPFPEPRLNISAKRRRARVITCRMLPSR